jgi:hypothetical protein
MLIYYFALKIGFFFALVKTFTKFEPLQKHWLFLSFLYTAVVAGLSWVFLIASQQDPSWLSNEAALGRTLGVITAQATPAEVVWRAWLIWLALTWALVAVYFGLMAKFSEGLFFWVLLIAGLAVVLF